MNIPLLLLAFLPFLVSIWLFCFPKERYGGQRDLALGCGLCQLGLLAWVGSQTSFFGTWQWHYPLPELNPLMQGSALTIDSLRGAMLLVAILFGLFAVVKTPMALDHSEAYYGLITLSLGLVGFSILCDSLLMQSTCVAMISLVQFFIAGYWGSAREQKVPAMQLGWWPIASATMLTFGALLISNNENGEAVFYYGKIMATIGWILLLPIFPWPRWVKIWHQAPLGLVAVSLLQSMVVILIGRYHLASFFIFSNHDGAVLLVIVGLLAAFLALYHDDVRYLADAVYCSNISLAISFMVNESNTSPGNDYRLVVSLTIGYLFILWLIRWMSAHKLVLSLGRAQGLATKVPRFCLFMGVALASLSFFPLFTPYCGMIAGVTGYQRGLENGTLMMVLTLLTIFLISAALCRCMVKICCGTPSIGMENDIRDLTNNDVVMGLIFLLALLFLSLGKPFEALFLGGA